MITKTPPGEVAFLITMKLCRSAYNGIQRRQETDMHSTAFFFFQQVDLFAEQLFPPGHGGDTVSHRNYYVMSCSIVSSSGMSCMTVS